MSTENSETAHLSPEETHAWYGVNISRRHLLSNVAAIGLTGTVLATASSPALANTVHMASPQQAQIDLYAALFVQTGGPAWVAHHGMTSAQYQATFNSLVAQGYRLILVDGYNVNGQDLFAAIFEMSSSPAWVAHHDMTSAQYQATFNSLVAQGYRLVNVSGYAL